MTNTNEVDYESKDFKNTVNVVMNDLIKSKTKLDTMDDMYNAVCKYIQVSREKFEEVYNQSLDVQNCELSEDELEMVVGGSIGEWFSDHAKTIGISVAILVATTALCTGLCAVVGLGLVAATGATSLAAGAGVGAAAGAISGAVVGTIIGIGAIVNNKYSNGWSDVKKELTF